jgi:hypothetical protein
MEVTQVTEWGSWEGLVVVVHTRGWEGIRSWLRGVDVLLHQVLQISCETACEAVGWGIGVGVVVSQDESDAREGRESSVT